MADGEADLDVWVPALLREKLQEVRLGNDDLAVARYAACHVHEDVTHGRDDLGLRRDDSGLGRRAAPVKRVDDLWAVLGCQDLEHPVLTQSAEKKIDHFC